MLKETSPRPKHPLIHPQFCEDLTDQECSDWSDKFTDHSRKLQAIMGRTGKLRPLVILVKFTDHADRVLPTREAVEELWNGAGISDNIPTGSIAQYYDKNSQGALAINATVFNWTFTDNTEAYYSFGKSGLTLDLGPAMYPALSQLDADGLDFSQFDLDGDIVIDVVIMLTSSFPAEIGGSDCFGRSNDLRIWAHAIPPYYQDFLTSSGYEIGSYLAASALSGTCGSTLATLGVIAHEMGHTWGIPDLYDTGGEFIGKGVGTYDIMANPYGLNGLGTYPNHMGPWTKMKSGWVTPTEITEDGYYELEASEYSNQAYKISSKYSSTDEYLLIENRQPILWDKLLFHGGILIWHIDESADNNNHRGFPGQAGWPGNSNHYMVALEQADRRYDLELGHNTGEQSDFWVNGSEYFEGPLDAQAINYGEYPNSNSYQGGIIELTGVRIFNFSVTGDIMSFQVSGLSPVTPQPSKDPASQAGPPTVTPSIGPSRSPVTVAPTSQKPIIASQPTTTGPSSMPSVMPVPGSSPSPSAVVTKSPSAVFKGNVDFNYFTNTPTHPFVVDITDFDFTSRPSQPPIDFPSKSPSVTTTGAPVVDSPTNNPMITAIPTISFSPSMIPTESPTLAFRDPISSSTRTRIIVCFVTAIGIGWWIL